jgi:methylisocitrate lyase
MDGGFGSASHVYHALQAYERAGSSAVMLEDQRSPKLACNWVASGREIYDVAHASAKIRAAVDARRDPETIIIARTDAEGDEIYRRGEAYAAAGAEMICALATSPSFNASCWRRLHEVTGLPLVLAPIPGTWQEKEFTPQACREVGIRMLALGLPPFNAAMTAIRDCYLQIKNGTPLPELAARSMSTIEFGKIIGLNEAIELEGRYTGTAQTAPPGASTRKTS